MSKIFSLPKSTFRLQLHTAITKYNKSQAQQPGSSFFHTPVFVTILLAFSLFLLGSCNEKVVIADVSKNEIEISALSKHKALGHVYKIHAALAQSPDRITALSKQELQWVLAKPDSIRVEGRSQVWHYMGQECVLDVYWIQKSNKIFVQDYYEFRERLKLFRTISSGADDREDRIEDWQCMQSLIQERRQKIDSEFDDLYAVLDLKEQRS